MYCSRSLISYEPVHTSTCISYTKSYTKSCFPSGPQNEQLQNLAEEARSLKDEMDILRHTSDKVSKYEGTIDTLKKKLEDLGDLKRQVKLLEDKNIMYMQNTMELEEVSS